MEKRAGMDDAVLEAKLRDAVRIAERGRPHFVGFLDERQAGVAQTIMRRTGFSNYLLWGGYVERFPGLSGGVPGGVPLGNGNGFIPAVRFAHPS